MEHYEFSRISYDKLKDFLEIVDNNVTSRQKDTPEITKLKKMFPLDSRLMNKLMGHTFIENNVIEVQDDSNEMIGLQSLIENVNQETSMDVVDPINVENVNHQENQDNVILLLNEMLSSQNETAKELIIITLSKHEQHIEYIFKKLKDHANILNISEAVSTCGNSKIVQVYCNLVLSKHLLSGTEGVSVKLQDFFENEAQAICSSISMCLLVISDEHVLDKDLPDVLSSITEANKANVLGHFLSECSQLNKIQMVLVNNLLHEHMELKLIERLLRLLTKNAINLSPNRNFGLLLENLMRKSNKNVLPLCDDFKNVLYFIPGILKLKLLKMLKSFE